MSALSLRGVSKRFGDTVALRSVDLEVNHGELVVLLGPSGCGKTTLLRAIAGLSPPDQGTIQMGDVTLDSAEGSVPPERRSTGLVFQNGVLFPHLSVARNIGFGLPKSERKESRRIDELLEIVGLTGFGTRTPDTLSGGQAQRVALARALAPAPDVLLMDEPFSNLDAVLRSRLRQEIADIVVRTDTTTLFVTHDRDEAFALGDRVAVMDGGQIQQVGTPREIYEQPNSKLVAEFVGEATFIAGETIAGVFRSIFGAHTTTLPDGIAQLMLRPDDLAISPLGTDPAAVRGRVTGIEYSGRSSILFIVCDPADAAMAEAIVSDPGVIGSEPVSVQVLVIGHPRVSIGDVVGVSATGGSVLSG